MGIVGAMSKSLAVVPGMEWLPRSSDPGHEGTVRAECEGVQLLGLLGPDSSKCVGTGTAFSSNIY